MAKRNTRQRTASKPRQPRPSKGAQMKHKWFILGVLAAGLWIVYALFTSMSVPADVNMISVGKDDPGVVKTGCYEQQVQCVKAPCPPILVCPSSSPVSGCSRDVFMCADGTRVGRTGDNCEFVCSTSTPAPIKKCTGLGKLKWCRHVVVH